MDNQLNPNHYAVIMAGGVGSRFWPSSTQKHPKQFLDILNCGKSLITLTFERFAKICPSENIYVVTNSNYTELVKQHLPAIPERNILKEPIGKNTAPCVAFAANVIHNNNPDASLIIAPADHAIGDEEQFKSTITEALNQAESTDWLITLGITPTRPDTGYGYIQFDDEKEEDGFFKVKVFTEKPELDMAKRFVDSGEFLWNSGIFIWSSKSILASFKANLPEVGELFSSIGNQEDAGFDEKVYSAYVDCANISIDYGILEKAENVFVKPASFDWSDVGTWNALHGILEKSSANNASNSSSTIFKESEGCMVNVGSKKLVVLNHVKDLIVVESDDVIMVADRNNEQSIKQLVNELKLKGGSNYV